MNTDNFPARPRFTGHKFYLFGLLFFSLFLILTAVSIQRQRASFFTRAGGAPSRQVYLENSYVFASPLEAAANGTAIIRVTVFLLDNQGLGVTGQAVLLKAGGPITVAQTQPTTDSLGKAIFDLTCNTPGSYTISAATSGASLPQSVSVSFR